MPFPSSDVFDRRRHPAPAWWTAPPFNGLNDPALVTARELLACAFEQRRLSELLALASAILYLVAPEAAVAAPPERRKPG
jgi:hypothetical protein